MPSCVASGCYNSSKKGAMMYSFPRALERRKIWIANVGGPSGLKYCRMPNKNSYLCEFHFTTDMFEKVDGKRKLKSSAMPIIFGELVIQRNERMIAAFIPDTEPATEIVVTSELTTQADQGSVSDIEPAAEIVVSNPVQGEEEFLSNTEPTKEMVVSHSVQGDEDSVSDTEPASEKCHPVFSAPVCLQNSDVCLNEDFHNSESLEYYKQEAHRFKQLYEKSEQRRIIMTKNYKKTQILFKKKLKTMEKECRKLSVAQCAATKE